MYNAFANRGLCHFYKDNHNQAISDLTVAIEHGVENEQIYSTRATAYQLLGKEALASDDRKKALLFNPRAIVDVRVFYLLFQL